MGLAKVGRGELELVAMAGARGVVAPSRETAVVMVNKATM